ncbi:S26 family signal peptidase [Dactylosporangium aurantiacum]|uniref:signal peptidase I n=1 Tax=Dactylosporangium aurantiacum TaxID=35754 RepID=A0A9Q9IGD7_9ACTN|nr:S26 family signal peptidase [Dactylosporangium aurantiacum]MDG6100904.1 S26 family signal peptidase [Dactylosporangium aurantiacum]UWZ55041.1 S26 family signal peptidase [Dactylosporangium aurantiacum]
MWFLALLASLAGAAWALRRRVFAVTVEGASMAPALLPGDRLLARRLPGCRVRPGQVVILEKPAYPGGWHWADTALARPADGHWMIKRVAAVAGDPVPPELASGGLVPAGSIVVLGDNRDASIDSRELGFIPVDRVLGVALRPVRSSVRS